MIVEAASAAHVARYFACRNSPAPARLYAHLMVQVSGAPAWAAGEPGTVIALGGVWWWPDDRPGEAWLMTDGLASSSLVPLVRVMRGLIQAQAARGTIVARWHAGHAAGAKLARLMGMTNERDQGIDGAGRHERGG